LMGSFWNTYFHTLADQKSVWYRSVGSIYMLPCHLSVHSSHTKNAPHCDALYCGGYFGGYELSDNSLWRTHLGNTKNKRLYRSIFPLGDWYSLDIWRYQKYTLWIWTWWIFGCFRTFSKPRALCLWRSQFSHW
jgi:hypothetical protein